MTYEQAKAKLKGKHSRWINGEYYLTQRDTGYYSRRVRVHRKSPVIRLEHRYRGEELRWHKDGSVSLHQPIGWRRSLHKKRGLNRYLPFRAHFFQREGQVYLRVGRKNYGYRCGIRIHADGSVTGDTPLEVISKRALAMRARINRERRREGRNKLQYWRKVARKHLPNRLTVAKILAERNVSIRLAKMYAYGMERFVLDSKAVLLDKVAGYQLLRLSGGKRAGWGWGREEIGIIALKMTCPSTGAVYINCVPPQLDTVSGALDWMFDTTGYLNKVVKQT